MRFHIISLKRDCGGAGKADEAGGSDFPRNAHSGGNSG